MCFKILILFIFLLFFPVHPADAKIIDRIVAVVNNDIITLSDLNNFKKKVPASVPQKEMLDALIEDKLLRQLIKKHHLVPEKEEVEAQINAILKHQGLSRQELHQFLKNRGLTYKDYRENIQKNMENERLLDREIKSSINIKDEDIRSYYYSHVKDNANVSTYHLRQLFFPAETKSEKEQKMKFANKASAEAKKKIPFEKILEQFSGESGGASIEDLGLMSEDDLIPPLKEAVKKLRIKEVSPPVVTPAGIHLMELLEVKKQEAQSFSEAKESIQKILYENEFKKILSRWIKAKKEEAYIKILHFGKKEKF